MKTAQEMYEDIQVVHLPQDKEALEKNLWTIQQAAKAWNVHYTTAKRLIERHAEEVDACKVMVRRPHGSSVRTMIRAGAARPSAPPGNPQFYDPDLQRQRAMERWDKEMTEADQLEQITNDVYKLHRCRSRLNHLREMGLLKGVDFVALNQRILEAEKRIGAENVTQEIQDIAKALDDH